MNQAKIFDWIFRIWGIVFFVVVCLAIIVAFGCASCEPTIVREEVIVKVPVEVKTGPLPVPEPVKCATPGGDDEWRNSAQYIKDCFDLLVKKIEEYNHVIVSFNESLSE